MSVQSEIDRIITAVGNAYSKVSEKGGTVPASQTVANLATAIGSIPAGGGAPSLLVFQNQSFEFSATNVQFRSCEFVKGAEIVINSNSRNVSFVNCYFDGSIIRCTQSIRDAIENESSNDVFDVSFDIVT